MKINCPHCGVTITASDKYAGRVATCPKCTEGFMVPEPEIVIREIRPVTPPKKKKEYAVDELRKIYRMYASMKGWNTTAEVVENKVQAWVESTIGPVGLAVEFYETGIDSAPQLTRNSNITTASGEQRVQTIERTGKTWKLFKAVGVILMLTAVGSCMSSGGDSSPITFIAGFVCAWIGCIGAWWHHS